MSRFILSLASILFVAGVTLARPQNVLWSQPTHLLSLPYYGGAKGQVLQIARDPSGTTLAQRIVPSNSNDLQQPTDTQNQIQDTSYSQQFANSLRNIQASAQKLVELQKKTTKSGQLKGDDQKVYVTHLALLGEAASSLAQIGTRGEYDLSQLFINKNGIDNKKANDKQDFDDEDENVGEEHEGDSSNVGVDEEDSIQINSESASVAEAKPVGVAIVGDGGVASSKPVATAVVGPGGLAIARPVATAIAGVDPSTVGFGTKIPISAKTPSVNNVQRPSMFQPIQQQYFTNPQYFIPQMPQIYPIELAIQ
ncbi:uncharacterized protein LOC143911375 [Arctopsyche grandis]|uniref:uncharacterized protein LOC143911375 n=1 Tax=Arctopsyche grandis TaxID=121162 RepID=UPI00406DA4E7